MKAICLSLCCWLFLTACSSEPEKKDPPVKVPQNQGVSGDTLSDGGMTVVQEGEETFAEWNQRLEQAILGEEYTSVKMDQVDKQPRFMTASREHFVQYRKKQPVDSKYGKQYPRFTWKSWQFSSEKKLQDELLKWLNGFESSDPDSIALGEEVDALKSPPFVCAVFENDLVILQGACIYKDTWQPLAESFLEKMKGEDPIHRMEVLCGAGKLSYISN